MNEKEGHIDNWALLARHFSGETTPEEETRVTAWREASEEQAEQYLQAQKLWAESAQFSQNLNINVDAAWENVSARIAPKTVAFIPGSWLAVAAAVVLLIVAGIYFLNPSSPADRVILADADLELEMPDGSTVWLAAGSELTYPEAFGENRKVKLKGTAYFEVSADKEHPFFVKTPNSEVRVVGTAFSLEDEAAADRVKLQVTEGKVRFCPNKCGKAEEEGELVERGEEAFVDKEEPVVIKRKASSLNANSWQSKQLYFKNTPLKRVVKDISRHFNREIALRPSVNSQRPYSGTLAAEKLMEVLEVIQEVNRLKLENTSGDTLWLAPR